MKTDSLTFIRALGEEYARKYNPNRVAPFPYQNVLAEHKDLEIHYADLDDPSLSGATLYKDGAFTIVVNNTKPERRQHFTLCHELGHYFLHKELLRDQKAILDGDTWLDNPNILYRLDTAQKTQVETEANNFAASLLMPADLVKRGWRVTQNVEELADVFQVSTVAMSVRLTKLGLVK